MPTIIRGNLRQSGLEMHDGHTSAPPYTFGSSLDSGMFYANGVGFAANGVHAMTISTTGVDVSGVLSGNAAGLTSIQAANVVGLTEALDIIQASSIDANVANIFGTVTAGSFIGDGSQLTGLSSPPGISNIQITDSTWTPIEDTVLTSNVAGYLVVNGTNFAPGSIVQIDGKNSTAHRTSRPLCCKCKLKQKRRGRILSR